LFASGLPHCAKANLSVWGRLPVGAALRPAIGAPRIETIDGAMKRTVMAINTKPVVRPEFSGLAKLELIMVPPSGIALRQCTGEKCTVMANLVRGVLDAVFVEESDGWVLIQSAKSPGWIQAYKTGKTP